MPDVQPSGLQASSIAEQLTELETMDADELRARYSGVTVQLAPAHLTSSLLRRILAYRVQARTLGDLDQKTVKLLDRIAKSNAEGASNGADQSSVEDLIPPPARRSIMPGAILAREFDGVMHRVTVLKDGYAWNGETYRSLSSAARAITGTRWNGPRFFGLRDRA